MVLLHNTAGTLHHLANLHTLQVVTHLKVCPSITSLADQEFASSWGTDAKKVFLGYTNEPAGNLPAQHFLPHLYPVLQVARASLRLWTGPSWPKSLHRSAKFA